MYTLLALLGKKSKNVIIEYDTLTKWHVERELDIQELFYPDFLEWHSNILFHLWAMAGQQQLEHST